MERRTSNANRTEPPQRGTGPADQNRGSFTTERPGGDPEPDEQHERAGHIAYDRWHTPMHRLF